jgi:tetratricopeptide (TPR) repeat protein
VIKILAIKCLWFGLLVFICLPVFSQDLSPKDRDEIRSRAIGLVKDYEQLLNVLATKGTTASDVQDIVAQATAEEGRMFFDNKVNIEDDLYSLRADSGTPKDVPVVKYLNDLDLFYSKSYEESVSFSDLRLSDFFSKDYQYLKVYFLSQLKNWHKDFARNYPLHKRLALIRFEKKGETWVAWISGISFFTGKKTDGSIYSQEEFEEDYKPFVKEKKARLISSSQIDSTLSESQINLQRQNDSLYAEAVKARVQKSMEQLKKDTAFQKSVFRGDSLLAAKDFTGAIDAFTEARSYKPFEIYPRTKINELARLLAGGSTDPGQIFEKQNSEGERLLKLRDYEGARQAFQMALNIFPDHAAVKEKIGQVEKVIRNRAETRAKYMAGNFKLALKYYSSLISENKTNPVYYFERAKCYQMMGDHKKALPDFNKALELDGSYSEALVYRALTFTRLNDLSKAISDYSTLISLDPKNSEFRIKRGQWLLQARDWDGALTDFEQVLLANPVNFLALSGEAEALRRKNQIGKSLEAAEKAIEVNPDDAGGHFQKGLCFLDKAEDEKAASSLSKAYQLGLGSEQESRLEVYFTDFFAKAKDAAAKGNTEEAILQAKKAIIVKPVSAESHYLMAIQLEKQGKENEALAALDRAVFAKENFSPAYLEKGRIFLRRKQFDYCLNPFYATRKYDKKNMDACLGLGEAFSSLGLYDSAMVWFAEALELSPDNSQALIKRGKCHFQMENYRRALMDFEDAIKKDKMNAEAYFYKGKINKQLKQTEKAIDDFNEAKALGFNPYECAVEVGLSYVDMGKYSKGIRYFTDAIRLKPNLAAAYAHRGHCYLNEEEYKEAMADLDEALKIDTSLGTVKNRVELGLLRLRFDDYKGAEKQFNIALDKDYLDPKANYGMGGAQYLLEKKELAMRHFEQAFIPRRLNFSLIKKDPWMKSILKDKEFQKLQKAYFR